MANYYKIIDSGYITAIGTGPASDENSITEEEYNNIRNVLQSRPERTDGFACRLTENLEWEQYEYEIPVSNELTAEEALEIITGGEV